jgi:hypothetical protein
MTHGSVPASSTGDPYVPQCHPRSRAANYDTCLGGSEWPMCFGCFLDALGSFDCSGYETLADLADSQDSWDAPCEHLSLALAEPFRCECPTCGHDEMVPISHLEICGDHLVCRSCLESGHATATGMPPHLGSRRHRKRSRPKWLATLFGRFRPGSSTPAR